MQMSYTINDELFEFFILSGHNPSKEEQKEQQEPLLYDSEQYQGLIEELKL